ncbi:MAG: phosphoglucomutase [Ignavibacteriaceae bacterium]
MSKISFGTDGWRALMYPGEHSQEEIFINEETIKIVAQAFADYLKKKCSGEIATAVGFDGRKNSEFFASVFAQVLSGNNIIVFLSDRICPTPLLSYFTKINQLAAGVMITASHNPPEYNGIKFKSSYGGPFLTEETLKVEESLGKSKILVSHSLITKSDFSEVYFKHVREYIDLEKIHESKLRVLVDSMGGAGESMMETILGGNKNSGFEIETIFSPASEVFYGRLAEPIKKNLIPLSEELAKGDYSIGLATDGDADRLGVMLENGEWLSAQETILLLTDYMVNGKGVKGHIVKTSSVTDKISGFFSSDKRKVFDVQVGFKYICEKMIEEDVAFGGEESGGFGFKNHIPERDGVFSGLIFIEMLANSPFTRLSEYVTAKRKEFGLIYYNRVDYHYYGADRHGKLPELVKNLPVTIGGYKVKSSQTFFGSHNNINGIKFYLEGNPRWLLIRSSETEPMFRFYAEGENDKEVEELLRAGEKLIG